VRAPSSGAGTTLRSYSRYADAGAGNLTRYYYLGDRLVGSWTVAAPAFSEVDPELILPPEPIVLPPGLLFPAAGLVLLATFLPLGGRRRLGVRVSLARSAGVSVILLSTSLPVVVFSAGCGTSSPSARVYHLDRLGSTQLVTDWDGGVYRHVRYYAYGEIRGRFDVHGNPIGFAEDARREFTGYETDFAGLDYAGARFFDPELAQFGTHDPAGQYPSPYAYGPGDPINGTDPSGEFWMVVIAVMLIVGTATAIDTYRATGSHSEAFKAGVLAGTEAGLNMATFGLYGLVKASWVQDSGHYLSSYALNSVTLGVYGAVQAFDNGQIATGIVGAAGAAYTIGTLAYGAYSAYDSRTVSGGETVASSQGGFDSQDAAGDAALSKANPVSIKENREYGGLLFEKDGQFGYTEPIPGEGTTVNPYDAIGSVPEGATVVGDYHTHGDYSRMVGGRLERTTAALDEFNSDHFSRPDLRGIANDGRGIPSYRGYL
jgi:RHS repeat-associated protein